MVASPDGEVLVVEGEAGIGKTALLDIACDRAAEAGVRVARTSADGFALEPPLGVLLRALASLWPAGDELQLAWLATVAAGDLSRAASAARHMRRRASRHVPDSQQRPHGRIRQ